MIDNDSIITAVAALILGELIVNKLVQSEVKLWDYNDILFQAALGTLTQLFVVSFRNFQASIERTLVAFSYQLAELGLGFYPN